MSDVLTGIDLAPMTTLKLGGPAERLIRAGTNEELIEITRRADAEGEDLFFLAGGSNVVISDRGVNGTTVLIETSGFGDKLVPGGGVAVTALAGESWDGFVARVVGDGLSGIECLSGIPGSVGATPIQNVGAYGQEVSDRIHTVHVLDRESGTVETLTAEECGFEYRSSRFKGNSRFLVLSVEFHLSPSALSEPIAYSQLAGALGVEVGQRVPLPAARKKVLDLRRAKSMVIDPADPDSVSAGSFFTNPILSEQEMNDLKGRVAGLLDRGIVPPSYPTADGRMKTSAAWLIERAGFDKGYGDGAIGLSRNHTLALVNRGGGTTAELVEFARHIAEEVENKFGVKLVPEPVFIGHDWR